VLHALASVAPAQWHAWIAWEMLLAGGQAAAEALLGRAAQAGAPATPAERMARALAQATAAARGGDRTAFDRAAADLRRDTGAWRSRAHEAAAVLACIDPLAEAPADPAVSAFIAGATARVPQGLDGLGAGAPDESELEAAVVVARPGSRGRRVLRAGRPLVSGCRGLPQDAAATAPSLRTDTAIAALALAGPEGLGLEAFFASVYGFGFQATRHQGVLDTLVHRMRARLRGLAVVERDPGERLTLVVERPMLLVDLRCAPPLADRVLRAVVALGAPSAQQAAAALKVPLRTVQQALQELVESGICAARREGNRVAYRIRDTIFTAITRPRWAPSATG
jgi:DNA-binding transcriptional ArsR family regulator